MYLARKVATTWYCTYVEKPCFFREIGIFLRIGWVMNGGEGWPSAHGGAK